MKGLPEKKKAPLQGLAEAIILQALEDLWNGCLRNESIAFFNGEGFRRYAQMAGMTRDEAFGILAITGRVLGEKTPYEVSQAHVRMVRL